MTTRDDDRTARRRRDAVQVAGNREPREAREVAGNRRRRVAARVAGLAAALGGGACLVMGCSAAPAKTAPVTAPATASPAVSPAPPAPAGTGTNRAMGPALPQTSPTLEVEQTQKGTWKTGGTLRVVAARGDLTGQRELLWVAGGVERYRSAQCTQRFQLSNNPKPARKPTLLVCWRTSARKSVIAVLVDAKGKPSRAKAVGELEKKWRAMG